MGLPFWHMELRQLEAFVAVATELHFGRAAEKLGLAQPTLSEMVRRLERELGAQLLTRTTRRVTLTGAGEEMLTRARTILDEVAAAAAAVKRVAGGQSGAVRVAITPPVAPVLSPHLRAAAEERLPGVEMSIRRMWLPDLGRELAEGTIDVAITCARLPDAAGVANVVFCSESLLVGLRPDHRLSGNEQIDVTELAGQRLGIPSAALFPAWSLAQRQALAEAGISAPVTELQTTDLPASGWTHQDDVDWIFLTASLGLPPDTVAKPTMPALRVPYTLQWAPRRAPNAAIARLVRLALTVDPPPGWHFESGHLGYRDADTSH